MSEPGTVDGPPVTTSGRLEALSDAVMAIALTLLVLDLITEHRSGDYGQELLEQWPGYLAYLAAFVTIASMWVSHHAAFSRVVRIDAGVLVLNLLLLLGIGLIPWPAALLASALADGTADDARAAVVAYTVVAVLISGTWTAMSCAMLRRPELHAGQEGTAWVRRNVIHSATAVAVLLASALVGLLVPVVALVLFLVVPLAFLVLSTRQHGGRTPARRAGREARG